MCGLIDSLECAGLPALFYIPIKIFRKLYTQAHPLVSLPLRVLGFILSLFVLSSCHNVSKDSWECRQSSSIAPPSTMISYRPACKDLLRAFETEVVYFCGEPQVYINLLLCPLEAPAESIVPFRYTINNDTYKGQSILLEGGQRLLVDQNDAERMIEAWCSEEEVVISL
jgi:hypothetical protein